MTDFPALGWNVPTEQYERFLEWVEQKHGYQQRYAAVEMEEAMRAFLDDDAGAAVEATVDDILDAAALPREAREKETVGENTTAVGRRINPELKDRFKRHVDQLDATNYPTGDRLTYGRVLGIALREHRDGGRWARVGDKLERVATDAEDVLGELTPDEQAGMTVRERRTVAICHQLGDQFTDGDLEGAIADVAGDSSPTISDYTEKVLDRLNYAEHPATRDSDERTIYIPAAEADQLARESAQREVDAYGKREAASTPAGADQAVAADGGHDADPERDSDEPDRGEAPTDASSGDDGPPEPKDLSTAQRQLLEDCGHDPDDPESVRAFFSDGEGTGTAAETPGSDPDGVASSSPANAPGD